MTEWIVVVPVKGTDLSKSRLADLPASVELRRQLALAFALDTVEALSAVADVVTIVVVTNDPISGEALEPFGVVRVADPGLGLNAAISAGIDEARRLAPEAAVAVMTADLPALTTDDIVDALRRASTHPASFVADLAGVGTTTIAALPGVDLVPRFGIGSARAHAESGMTPLDVARNSTLRRDIDTPDDLSDDTVVFGSHTRRVLDRTDDAGRSTDK